ncbi:TorF family putative porin [Pseudoduganella danionis]|uniref:Uncharacterized protein n=1 Tax=Pseudoduganella danionis TaxID=1890295 RepID=A0ABW9SL89_9BURK|nr:TorF family putative porin [Pseudoduganella danionis]MTW31479.1 hypothetical protein [Pseudoduganella danionis]
MQKLIIAAALATISGASWAQTDDASSAVSAEHASSYNLAVVTDYRYRGISQTRFRPAVQGGFDYSHSPSGLYAGSWLSTIQWTRDAGGSGMLEWDLYAGRRGQLDAQGRYSYDFGVLRYLYPANALARVSGYANANTTELYAQLGAGPVYLKYSYAVTNLFGFVDSRHSGYLDAGANLELDGGYTLNLHAGRQQVQRNGAASYSDWKLGLTRDFGVLTGALAVIGTTASKTAYASPADGRYLGKTALQLTLSKVF